jgi:hypothetical protein
VRHSLAHAKPDTTKGYRSNIKTHIKPRHIDWARLLLAEYKTRKAIANRVDKR